MNRPCYCDNVRKGEHYTDEQCRDCWRFYHTTRNQVWGGDGKLIPLPPRTPEQMNEYRTQRQKEIRCRPQVGTHLKKLISYFGVSDNGCGGCKGHAADMNKKGVVWCKANKEIIVGWMAEEAFKRGIPFIRTLAYPLVDLAIRNAEAEAAWKVKELT
jgi:hypothetical protein